MKKVILPLFAIALFCAFSGNAHAGTFEKFYTVNSYGSYAEQNTFNTAETPYLYVKLADAGINYKSAFWNSPYGQSYLTGDDRINLSSAQEAWFSIDSWHDQTRIGKWVVNGNYLYAGGALNVGAGTYNFSVTPEPASLVLFLVGGLALAAVVYSRKKSSLATARI